ncbi:sulfatase [Haloarcula onubensis]|uniref:Sulfatase n=1 Tax=Haloarcula onubensis TaxID=2950539 RepID=A0ABU2FJ56_9EURY|nr:sulfatase [Halomicroarcula sp. S3CR25-11]MDS0280784.1 sulfatase [Halomicroarcula sp. S3CR25-11]
MKQKISDKSMERPNVLLLIMDTARLDVVQSGIRAGQFPSLRRIADEGVLFEKAISNAPWTLPSHSSIFSGEQPSSHLTYIKNKEFSPSGRPLAKVLQDSGYETVGYSNNFWITPELGFDDGFDEFYLPWTLSPRGYNLTEILDGGSVRDKFRTLFEKLDSNAPFTLGNLLYGIYLSQTSRYDDGAKRTTKILKQKIQNSGSAPFFIFANYMEPHLPYHPPDEYYTEELQKYEESEVLSVNQDPWEYVAEAVQMDDQDFDILRELYRSEIRYLDAKIGEVLDTLENESSLDETMVIIAGDHGEHIGENEFMDHQYSLSEYLIQVPLLVRYPERFPENETVSSLVELRDIYPTILNASVGKKWQSQEPDSVSRKGLSTALEAGREYAVSEYLEPQPQIEDLRARVSDVQTDMSRFDRALRSIRTPESKFIESSDDDEWFFEFSGGRKPLEDESARQELRSLMENLPPLVRSPDTADADLSESTEDRLSDLGYI